MAACAENGNLELLEYAVNIISTNMELPKYIETINCSWKTIEWLHNHGIIANINYALDDESEQFTVDNILLLCNKESLNYRTWNILANKCRIDLLRVLLEAGYKPGIVEAVFHREIYDLLLEYNVRFENIGVISFEYLQWCYMKDMPKFCHHKSIKTGFAIMEHIWLIERDYWYNNDTWAIHACDIPHIKAIADWLSTHTYTLHDAIIVTGFEDNYVKRL